MADQKEAKESHELFRPAFMRWRKRAKVA
jgi:hypothetical protein